MLLPCDPPPLFFAGFLLAVKGMVSDLDHEGLRLVEGARHPVRVVKILDRLRSGYDPEVEHIHHGREGFLAWFWSFA